MATSGHRQSVFNIAKYALSALLVATLAWQFRNEVAVLADVKAWAVLLAVALLLAQPVLIGLRWLLLLRLQNSAITPSTSVRITWFAVLANQVLPASVGGDAVRVLALLKLGEAGSVAVGTVVVDRLLALVALALVMAACLPWLLAGTADWLGGLLAAGGVSLCLGLVLARPGIRWLMRKLPENHRLHFLLGRVLPVLALLGHPRVALVTLALSLAVHVLSLAAFLALAHGLGVDVATKPLLAVGALLAFVQVVPISIGGWGPREAAAVMLLGMLGIAGGTALALSILLGLAYAAASLPGAAAWLFNPTRR